MGRRDEHTQHQGERFFGRDPMIRIGSVGEPAYDVRADVARPLLPRPRGNADVGSAVRTQA